MMQNVPGASTRDAYQIKRDLIDALGKTGIGFADADRVAEIVSEAGFAEVRSPCDILSFAVAAEGSRGLSAD